MLKRLKSRPRQEAENRLRATEGLKNVPSRLCFWMFHFVHHLILLHGSKKMSDAISEIEAEHKSVALV